jgi:hypothetical protein
MFEFGFALLAAIFIAGLLIVFRRLRSLKRRLDRLVLDHNILANRALLFTLNRVQAEPIVSPTSAPSIAPGPNLGRLRRKLAVRRLSSLTQRGWEIRTCERKPDLFPAGSRADISDASAAI